MVEIDGAFGEGGGQIVRSALAMSLVTGQSVRISNLRARREKPGLRAQHLAAVTAAATISSARMEGAAIGSTRLVFEPSVVGSGDYVFRVGTAGSATLVLQTVLPALLLASGPSTLTVEGGTHNPLAPPFEFLARTYLPLIHRMGANVRATLERHGFYPAGGGRIRAQITPADRLEPLELTHRGQILAHRVRALVANLPQHIAQRECAALAHKSGWDKRCFQIEEHDDAAGPGNVVLVEVESEQLTEVFAGFGQRGVRAEQVAARVWREVSEYLATDVPVATHLADQLLLPLSIAARSGRPSQFRALPLTLHATTQIELIRQFLGVTIEATTDGSGQACVRVGGPSSLPDSASL